MVKSHATMLEPALNLSMLTQARSSASWVRSFALSTSRHSDRANRRSCGTASIMAVRVEWSRFMTIILVSGLNHGADRVQNEFPEIATACLSESKNVRGQKRSQPGTTAWRRSCSGHRDHH